MANVLVDESALSSIASAIREKNGTTTTYKPAEMAPAVLAISSGGGALNDYIPEEAFTITGDCQYRFSYDGWNWFIDKYKDRIQTKNLSSVDYMFNNSYKLKDIGFVINLDPNLTYNNLNGVFSGCGKLRTIPPLIGGKIRETWNYSSALGEFNACYSIKEIPQEWLVGFANNTNRFISCYALS